MTQLLPAQTPLVKYRNEFDDVDELMGTPIKRYSSLDELEFDSRESARYIVNDGRFSLPLDMLFIPRSGSRRLLVGLHGAEGRATASLPKFQFVRSFSRRTESLLFLADSTLLQGERINIGWYAGNATTPLADLYSEIVRRAGATANVSETVLVGHSAGGFAAILIGSMVPSSRAISVNGQTVVGVHEPWTVKNLHDFAFPECASVDEMTAKHARRLDLRRALDSRKSSSSFTYFANRADPSSFDRLPHFPLLAEHFGLPEDGGRTDFGDALVVCDWQMDGVSPHAMPGSVDPFLSLVLGEGEPSVAISCSVSPAWNRPGS